MLNFIVCLVFFLIGLCILIHMLAYVIKCIAWIIEYDNDNKHKYSPPRDD